MKKKLNTSENSEEKNPKAEYALLNLSHPPLGSVTLYGQHRAKGGSAIYIDLLPPPQFKSEQNTKRYILLRITYKISN